MAEVNGIVYEPADCFDTVKGKRGRPRLRLNGTGIAVVSALARMMCTDEEIAACLGVSVETLQNEANLPIFSECLKKERNRGKISLRMSQFRLAEKNANMAIWLGKQYLGQRDQPADESDGFNDTPAEINVIVEDASGGDEE